MVTRRKFLKGAAVAAPGIAAANVLGAQRTSGRTMRWDREVDAVNVGTGFAGLAAAIAAKDAGAKVIVLEKMPREHEGGNQGFPEHGGRRRIFGSAQYMEALCSRAHRQSSLRALAEEMMQLNAWLETLE